MRFLNKKTGSFISVPDRYIPIVTSLIRSDEYIFIKNDDSEHWITLHGGEGEGQHVLINGAGQVVGGAGGKLNGKELGNVKSKSKDVSKPTETPTEPPKEPEKPKEEPKTIAETPIETPEQITERLSKHANQLSEQAHTLEDHQKAKEAHLEASYKYVGLNNADLYKHHYEKYKYHFEQAKQLLAKQKREESRAKKKEFAQTEEGKSKAAKEAMFATQSVQEIDNHFRSKFNLGFANGSEAKKEADKAWKNYVSARRQGDPNAEDYKNKYHELIGKYRSVAGANIRSHTPYDITSGSTGGKAVRKLLGHVDSALTHMESLGFNVKEALAKGNVQFAAGTTGRANGHAWQSNGVGYFSLSTTKRLETDPEQTKYAQRRKEEGKPRWTVSSGSEDQARATIVHELAHALGMQPHINSPAKLKAILDKQFDKNYGNMREWIKTNISEYATENIKETDAELAAMVTAPDYVRGTLPKELEDHVDELFMRTK